jgi:hypothetical protein
LLESDAGQGARHSGADDHDLEAGAQGYILKSTSPDQFIRALETILTGGLFAPASLSLARASTSLASAAARHAIRNVHRGCRLMPRLAGSTYGACAHAATAAFYARAEEIETVTETGHYCARALLQSIGDEDADVTEPPWIWDFAVSTINTAAGVCAVETR